MNSHPDSQRAKEKELVQRVLDGNRRAFEEFADDYLPPLYRFASRRLNGDRELVVEVVQATMCKAIDKLETFRGEAALMTWLCACCRNEIAAHFRGQAKRGREVEFDSLEQVSSTPIGESGIDGPEHAAMRQEIVDQVHSTLDGLSPKYANALEWKYLHQLSVAEIAKRLGLSVKAAESVLTRARAAFRELYGQSIAPLESTVSQSVLSDAGIH